MGLFSGLKRRIAKRKISRSIGAKGYGMSEERFKGYTHKLADMSDKEFGEYKKKKGSHRIKARNLAGVRGRDDTYDDYRGKSSKRKVSPKKRTTAKRTIKRTPSKKKTSKR